MDAFTFTLVLMLFVATMMGVWIGSIVGRKRERRRHRVPIVTYVWWAKDPHDQTWYAWAVDTSFMPPRIYKNGREYPPLTSSAAHFGGYAESLGEQDLRELYVLSKGEFPPQTERRQYRGKKADGLIVDDYGSTSEMMTEVPQEPNVDLPLPGVDSPEQASKIAVWLANRSPDCCCPTPNAAHIDCPRHGSNRREAP